MDAKKKSGSFSSSEASKEQLDAFRLYRRVTRHNTYYTKYTCITITPKGEHKSHDDILQPFLNHARKYKAILDVFLIAESSNTNHFHGVLVTKTKCKFSKFYNKKNPYTFYISDHMPITVWSSYMTKSNPNTLILLNEIEKFLPIFQTDVALP